jgi:hypothetical protein
MKKDMFEELVESVKEGGRLLRAESSVIGRKFPADAFDSAAMVEVVDLLATLWDPNGEIVSAAVSRCDKDSVEPRSCSDYAKVICGIAAAGGSQASLMGYLRREEEELFGTARTTGSERSAVARGVWKAVGRQTRREMCEGFDEQTASED